jgi:thiamine transporter ThiT
MREFLIIASMLTTAAAYVFHFLGGDIFFGKNYPHDYTWATFLCAMIISGIAILLEGFESFFVIAFVAALGGFLAIYHFNYL